MPTKVPASMVSGISFNVQEVKVWGNDDTTPELLVDFPITTGSPYQYYRAMQVLVTGVAAGDILEVWSHCQVTSEQNYDVMMASWLNLQTSPGHSADTDIAEITERTGQNFNGQAEHHFVVQNNGIWVAPQAYTNVYANLWLYAASTAAQPNDRMKLDQDYGRLYVKHWYTRTINL